MIPRGPRAGRLRAGLVLLVGVCGLLLAAVSTLAAPATAFAHAKYESSNPAPDSVLKAAPSTITIHFAEDVNPNGSAITVYDAKGNQVSTGAAQVDASDPKTMTVGMKGDGSSPYLVTWHNVSADDGDPDTGAFVFNVNPDAPANVTSPKTTTTTSASSGVAPWLAAVIGVLGLLIGGAVGVFFSRRNRVVKP